MLKYKTEQLVFMTIDLYDGQVYEVSKNILNLLEQAGIVQYKDIKEIQFSEKRRILSEIVVGFNIEEIRHL